VTDGAAAARPGGRFRHGSLAWRGEGSGGARLLLAALAVLGLVAALVPPLSSEARRVEALEALQFALLGIGVPALVALSAPWRLLGLAGRRTGATDAEGNAVLERPRMADRAAATRRRHPRLARGLAPVALATSVFVAWRVPAIVDALARHGWLSLVEAVTLVGAGTGLWLELVESPPFAPRLTRPQRIAVAAIVMWTIWVTAYIVGMSHTSMYRAYAHVAGRDLSVSADQAFSTGILWLASLCAFLPLIFSNLMKWLRSDEDADAALYRLVRDGDAGSSTDSARQAEPHGRG